MTEMSAAPVVRADQPLHAGPSDGSSLMYIVETNFPRRLTFTMNTIYLGISSEAEVSTDNQILQLSVSQPFSSWPLKENFSFLLY